MSDSASDPLNASRLAELDDLDYEGEPSIVVELIDDFLGSAPVSISALKEAQAALALEPAQRIAHTLRGSSRNIGADRMGALCSRIESLANEEALASAEPIIRDIETEFELARLALVAERAKRQ
jgi:HPt (histidine-containing phosphotransfer) domain-containing protein